MIDRNDLKKLQKVSEGPSCTPDAQGALDEIEQRGYGVGGDESLSFATLDSGKDDRGILGERITVGKDVQNDVRIDENPHLACFSAMYRR